MAARHTTVLLRSVLSLVVGVVVGVIVTPLLGLAAGLLAGWAALALTSVAWVLLTVWSMDAARTRAHATAEDPGRRIARLVALVGSIASLGAVAVVLLQTRHAGDVASFFLAGISVVAVAASWALIQVDYLLRYAHVYYSDPVGGIDFNQEADPEYTDFAYFSVGLGMTYQVADTNVRTNAIRRIIIAQTLLAYLFGAVILATVINLVTSLG
ncbi:DUF1345 domain-containing protein [Microbacterium ulmi]|uniref:DUF1345 domain-containing protein n=1 Tax=Microbacterium ulmi TaxID=179095 RepID=A0A7Y2M1L1_9MICO|nr:DUF1345 domain-containing protein [Microbacterium ulmi]NII71439.1 putative membrane protein [Microbacterium ulmi]NNH04657.1 DUF1345 domain-containing protein [Microbacterium ulmi]